MKNEEIDALTGLRGIAACLVALYHFTPAEKLPLAPLRSFIGRGYLWVDLFFVLSGFVIALNYGSLFEGPFTARNLGIFLARRIARLYPLYLALLGMRIVYTLILYGGFDGHGDPFALNTQDPAKDVTSNLFLVQAWGITSSILISSWSVSTELAVYLAFPILAMLILYGDKRSTRFFALIAALSIAGVALYDQHDGEFHRGALDAWDGSLPTPLMRCFGGFVLGVICWRLTRQEKLMGWIGRNDIGCVILGTMLLLLACGAPDLAVVAMFPPLVLHLSCGRGWLGKVMSSPVAMKLGAWSYAIYLVHPMFETPLYRLADVLSGDFPGAVAALMAGCWAVACLLTFSGLAHICIERPGRRWVRKALLG